MKTIKLLSSLTFLCLFGLTSCSNDDDSSSSSEVLIHTPQTESGYFLVTPVAGRGSFLLDDEGYVVHKYPSTKRTFMGYLQPDGKLVRIYQILNSNFNNNGESGGIEIVNEAGDILWHYEISSPNEILHHDIEVLPNGNILALIWYKIDSAEAINLGRNPNLLTQNEVHLDKIIEIEPVGNNSANIVWQWDSKNHLVQDYDASKLNFGNINQNPGKLNINYTTGVANHTHINGMSYDPERDLIMLSSKKFNEIWMLDHSTSTSEAASTTGGNSGKGGEILYRFGNPEAFGNGSPSDKILFGQHDPTFISSTDSFGGNILLFNNNVASDQSAVMEFNIPFNGLLPDDSEVINNLPNNPVWSFQSNVIYSSYISGAQRLPNGNTFITVGTATRVIEINQFGEIVFRMDFKNPKQIFKIRKYPTDYSGLPSNLDRIPEAIVTND